MMQFTEEHGNVLIKGVVTYSRLFEALRGMYEVEDDDAVWEIFNQTDDPIEDVVCALRLLYTTPPAPAIRLPDYRFYEAFGFNAFIDEVKRLNATAPQPVKRPATKCIGWVRDAIHEHDAKWEENIRAAGCQVEK